MLAKFILSGGILLAAGLGSGARIEAAPVTFTHDYGTSPGLVAPEQGGAGNMAANLVTVVSDATGDRFRDGIAFADSGFGTISSLTLALSIAGARGTQEDWRVYGATGAGEGREIGTPLGNGSSWSITVTSGDVFDQATAAGSLTFWFFDAMQGRRANDFRLYSASVTVDGTHVAPIPLPAAGLLLLGALGGLGLMRRAGQNFCQKTRSADI